MSAQRELAELLADIEQCERVHGQGARAWQFLRTHGPALAELIEAAKALDAELPRQPVNLKTYHARDELARFRASLAELTEPKA